MNATREEIMGTQTMHSDIGTAADQGSTRSKPATPCGFTLSSLTSQQHTRLLLNVVVDKEFENEIAFFRNNSR